MLESNCAKHTLYERAMDMNEVLEIIKNPGVIVFITGAVGAGAYLFQDWRKTVADSRDKKRELYEVLLENIFRLFYVNSPKEKSELVTKIEKCWLFSSDGVLKACYSLLELFDATAKNHRDIGKALRESDKTKTDFEDRIAQIFFHMRKDLRGRTTKIDEKWAEKNIVIYKWGALMNVSKEESHNNAMIVSR